MSAQSGSHCCPKIRRWGVVIYDSRPCASDDGLHEPGPSGTWKVCHVVRPRSMGMVGFMDGRQDFCVPSIKGEASIGCVR